jgi:hypothetical protein
MTANGDEDVQMLDPSAVDPTAELPSFEEECRIFEEHIRNTRYREGRILSIDWNRPSVVHGLGDSTPPETPTKKRTGDHIMATSHQRLNSMSLSPLLGSNSISAAIDLNGGEIHRPETHISLNRVQSHVIYLDGENHTPQPRGAPRRFPSAVIDLDNDDNSEPLFEEEEFVQIEFNQLSAVEQALFRDDGDEKKDIKKFSLATQRCPPLGPQYEERSEAAYNGISLRLNKTFEIKEKMYFLRIQKIYVNRRNSQDIILRGQKLVRAKHLDGMFSHKINELVWIVDIDDDDPRDADVQSAWEVRGHEIKRVRFCNMTNLRFPAGTYRGNGDIPDEVAMSEGQLACRWKYSIFYATGHARIQERFRERVIKHLKEKDTSTQREPRSDAETRFSFRGETILGGAFDPANPSKYKGQIIQGKNTYGWAEQTGRASWLSADEIEAIRSAPQSNYRKQKNSLDDRMVDLTLDNQPGAAASQPMCIDDESHAVERNILTQCNPVSLESLQVPLFFPLSERDCTATPINSEKTPLRTIRKPVQKYLFGDSCK